MPAMASHKRFFLALHVSSAKATTQEQLNKKFIELAQEKEAGRNILEGILVVPCFEMIQ